MAEALKSVLASLPKEQQAAITNQTTMLIAEEMALRDLRKALEYSQQVVSKKLNVNQSEISKIEHRTDMYLSTLRSYIEAMGGELDIIAKFPDRPPIRINQFEQLAG